MDGTDIIKQIILRDDSRDSKCGSDKTESKKGSLLKNERNDRCYPPPILLCYSCNQANQLVS